MELTSCCRCSSLEQLAHRARPADVVALRETRSSRSLHSRGVFRSSLLRSAARDSRRSPPARTAGAARPTGRRAGRRRAPSRLDTASAQVIRPVASRRKVSGVGLHHVGRGAAGVGGAGIAEPALHGRVRRNADLDRTARMRVGQDLRRGAHGAAAQAPRCDHGIGVAVAEAIRLRSSAVHDQLDDPGLDQVLGADRPARCLAPPAGSGRPASGRRQASTASRRPLDELRPGSRSPAVSAVDGARWPRRSAGSRGRRRDRRRAASPGSAAPAPEPCRARSAPGARSAPHVPPGQHRRLARTPSSGQLSKPRQQGATRSISDLGGGGSSYASRDPS